MWNWLVRHHRHVIVLLILIISFQLAYSDVFSRGPFVYPSKLIYQGGTIIMDGFAKVINKLKQSWNNYIALIHVREENAKLKKQIQLLEIEVNQLNYIKTKYHDILNILNLPPLHSDISYVTAIVIGRDMSAIFKSISVNKGTIDGVKKGDGVISQFGVVGRVIKVTPYVSEVLLLTDVNSFIEGIDEQTKVRGIINGTGLNRLNFMYVLSNAPITNGDTIVTGGEDGVFPGGIPIGKVIQIKNKPAGWLFKDVIVQPEIDLNRLDYVMILTGGK